MKIPLKCSSCGYSTDADVSILFTFPENGRDEVRQLGFSLEALFHKESEFKMFVVPYCHRCLEGEDESL
jgi:hypothetical protein